MKQKSLRPLLVVVALCALAAAAHAQQPTVQPRRGGLDSMSLVTHAGGSSADAAWQLFAPEGAGFAVLLPGVPEEVTKRGREAGATPAQFRSYRLAADGVKYEFGRTAQLPASVVGQTDFSARFFAQNAEAMKAALQHENPQLRFVLTSERAVNVAGYEGREYVFTAPGVRSVARVYLIERAIFALAASGSDAALPTDKANKFFDSFSPQ
jgi:hypothetical protein